MSTESGRIGSVCVALYPWYLLVWQRVSETRFGQTATHTALHCTAALLSAEFRHQTRFRVDIFGWCRTSRQTLLRPTCYQSAFLSEDVSSPRAASLRTSIGLRPVAAPRWGSPWELPGLH